MAVGRAHHLNSVRPGKALVQRVDVTYLAEGPDGKPAIDSIRVFQDPGGIVPLDERAWEGNAAETMIRAAVANALSSGHVTALRRTMEACRDMLVHAVDVLTDDDGAAKLDPEGNPMLSEGFLAAYKHLTSEVLPTEDEDGEDG